MARRSSTKWNYGYGIKRRSSSSLFRMPKTTTRRSSSKTHNHASSYSSYRSPSTSMEQNSGCGVALGIIFMIVFGALILWSFTWPWESSKVNYWGHVERTDWSFFKWLFYPVTIGGFLFGVFGLKISLNEQDKNQSQPITSSNNTDNTASGADTQSNSSPVSNTGIGWQKPTDINISSRMSPDELRKRQWGLRDIYVERELRDEAELIHNETKKYSQDEMINGLTALAFDGMTDYYTKKQLAAIQSGMGDNKQKVIGEILLLVSELDSYRGDSDTSHRLLVHVLDKIKTQAKPLIALAPDTKLFDVRINDFISDAELLINDRKKGIRIDDSFEALLHK